MSFRAREFVFSLTAALFAAGCMYDNGHHEDCMGPYCQAPPVDVQEATIDTGATLGGVSGSTSISAGSISIQSTASILGQPCSANSSCVTFRTVTGHLTISNEAALSPTPIIATDDTLPLC